MTATTNERVLFDVDQESRIATITLNNPKQRNSYDAAMRDASAAVSMSSPKTTTSPSCCCAEPTVCSAPGPI